MNTVQQTFAQIIALSQRLHKSDENWRYEIHEPISREKATLETGAILPAAYVDCMAVSNGFMVDFSSTVGYFMLYPISDFSTEEQSICIGWANHDCLYFNPKNGEFVIEYQRYQYTPITDFNEEVLVPVVKYLEQQLIRTERRHALLEQQKDNPLREYFDAFMAYRDNGMDLYIYPPLTEEEISDWEKTHVKLPETYRNWLLLTGKCILDQVDFYDLDHVFLEKVFWSDQDSENREYWFLADTTGYGTVLLLDPESGKLFEFDHDSDEPWTEIEDLDFLLENALEWIEEM